MKDGPTTPTLTVTILSPRCLALTLGGATQHTSWGVNCLAVTGRDGTLLVDPFIAPAHARLLEAEVRRRNLPPVTHVVLTHHHTDHALGAGWFARRGASCISHPACAAAMATEHPGIVAHRRADPLLAELYADADPHVPGHTFTDRWQVDLGGLPVEVRHAGHGHTRGDAVILVPDEGVAASGDLLFNGFHVNYEDADLHGLMTALDRLEALGARTLVPGHGPVGGPGLVDEQRRYHDTTARLIRAAPDGASARDAVFAAFPGHAMKESVDSALRWRS